MNTLPFPIPQETKEQIDHTTRIMAEDADEPAIWERYANPDHDLELEEWPPTIEAFREWYRRHSGIIHLIKAVDPQLRKAEWDHSEENFALVTGAMNTLIEHTRQAFGDFGKLLEWAIVAWEHDPVIQNMATKKDGEDKETGGES